MTPPSQTFLTVPGTCQAAAPGHLPPSPADNLADGDPDGSGEDDAARKFVCWLFQKLVHTKR